MGRHSEGTLEQRQRLGTCIHVEQVVSYSAGHRSSVSNSATGWLRED